MRFIRKLSRVRPIETVHRTTLPSGIKVLVEEIPQVPSLSLGVWVQTGSRDEPAELCGISHFIEHMVFKGSRRRSALQIAKRAEKIGGQVDAFTTREQTCYYARVFEEHLADAMQILGELVSEPAFEREMVTRERSVVVEEIESYENTPEELAHDLTAAQVWPNHALGRPILGTRETIHRFGSRNLRQFHRENYTADNIVIAVSGRVSTQMVCDLVQKCFRVAPRVSRNGSAPLTRFRSRAVEQTRDLTQANLCIASRGPSYHGADRHALGVVNVILGAGMSSRLYQRIREQEGLAYSVYSFFDVLRDTGLFGVYLGVAPRNATKALALTCKEIRRLKKTGIRRWELESAKAQLLMAHFLSYESTYERMSRIAQSEICYGRQAPLEQVVDRVQRITRDEVQAALERYLRPQRFTVVTLGPPGVNYPRSGDWDF